MTRGSDASARTAQVTKLLANNKAQFVSYESRNRIFNDELTRIWPVERDDLLDAAITYLKTIDSVTTPNVGPHEAVPGLWRVVDVRKASYANTTQFGGASGVIQVLRRGYSQTLDWTEARIINYKESEGNTSSALGQADTASDNPDKFMLVEFVNLDPATAPGLLTSALGATTYANFVVRGVTYTETYHKIAATVLESEFPGDGSVRIQVLLAQPQYTLEAFRDYVALYNGQRRSSQVFYLWGVPKDLAQPILDTFEGSGRTATADYSIDGSLVNLTLVDSLFHPVYGMYSDALGNGGACSYTDTTQFYWGIYDPTASVYDPSSFSDFQNPGITYDRTIRFDKETGYFDIVITRRTTLTRRYNPYVSRLTSQFYDTTYTELGVTDNVYFDLPADDVQGQVYTQNVSPNPDCSKDVQTEWTISEPQQWYDAVVSDSGVHGFWWFINQRAVPSAVIDGLAATNNNRISIDQNIDKTYNVTIATAPQATTITGYADFYYTEGGVRSGKVTVGGSGDKVEEKTLTAVYTVKRVSYHATEAQAHQTGGAASCGPISVSKRGAVWRAERVVRVQTAALTPADASNFYLTNFDIAGDVTGLGALT